MNEASQNQLDLIARRPYSDDDSSVIIDLGNDTAWVTQKQIATLFGLAVSTVNEAIKRIKKERGANFEASIRTYRIVTDDGKEREVEHYDMTIVNLIGARAKHSAEVAAFQDWVGKQLNRKVITVVKQLAVRKYRQLRASGYSNDEAMQWHERDLISSAAFKDISREWYIRNGDFPRLVNHSTRFVLGMSSSAWKRKHKTKESPRRYMSSVKKTALGLVEGIAAGFHRVRRSQGTEALERDITDAASLLDWDRLNELLPDTDIVPTPKPDQKKLLPGQ